MASTNRKFGRLIEGGSPTRRAAATTNEVTVTAGQ